MRRPVQGPGDDLRLRLGKRIPGLDASPRPGGRHRGARGSGHYYSWFPGPADVRPVPLRPFPRGETPSSEIWRLRAPPGPHACMAGTNRQTGRDCLGGMVRGLRSNIGDRCHRKRCGHFRRPANGHRFRHVAAVTRNRIGFANGTVHQRLIFLFPLLCKPRDDVSDERAA